MRASPVYIYYPRINWECNFSQTLVAKVLMAGLWEGLLWLWSYCGSLHTALHKSSIQVRVDSSASHKMDAMDFIHGSQKSNLCRCSSLCERLQGDFPILMENIEDGSHPCKSHALPSLRHVYYAPGSETITPVSTTEVTTQQWKKQHCKWPVLAYELQCRPSY